MSELIEKRDAYNILKDMICFVRRDVLLNAYDTLKNLPTVKPASPWHRVEDELPSMDGYDLVLGVVTGEAGFLRFHKAIMTVSFDPEYKEWFIDEYPDAKITVSHWMLLPEPPKEDMDGERREG